MTDREILIEALYALEDLAGVCGFNERQKSAYQSLQARLAQPEPKYQPMHPELRKMYEDYFDAAFEKLVPPQREWVGLTTEELNLLWVNHHGDDCLSDGRILSYEQAIETKLREKNT